MSVVLSMYTATTLLVSDLLQHVGCVRRQYQLHVQSHFFTNAGVAGGLLLLQTFGAGKYSGDAVLKKKGL